MRTANCANLAANEEDASTCELQLHRLEARSRLFDPLTEQLFRQSGLREGMRVLAVGCGTGDIAYLAAEFVGPSGSVVGIDDSEAALLRAIDRTLVEDGSNVDFVCGGIDRFSGTLFDAVVGRFQLMHEPDPVATLWRFASLVRDGGILAVQEFDFTQAPLIRPEITVAAEAVRWIAAALGALGYDVGMGMRLHQSFLSAGLPRPSMLVGAAVEHGTERSVCDLIAESVRDLMDPICAFDIATPDEIDVATLASRIHQSALETDAVIASPLVVSAWTRVARRPTGQLASQVD